MNSVGTRLLAAAASGVMLGLCFPSLYLGLLGYVAFVPLLLAIRGLRPRSAAGYGWAAGIAFFVTANYWIPDTISNFTSIPPVVAKGLLVLMSAVGCYGHVVFAWGLEWLAARGVSRLLAAPALWVVCEWMRTFVIAEFPWSLLGYSQLPYGPLAQAADLGGVYLLSAVLMLTSAAIAEATFARGGRALRYAVLAALCPVLLYVYGHGRLAAMHQIPYSGSIRVAAVQGNIAQDQKWDKELSDRILEKYLRLSRQAADAGAQLVVWPEAALPFYMQRDLRSMQLVKLARERGIDLLVGAPGLEKRPGRGTQPYNQAWLIRADGRVEGPYDKIQLVPFGEYIPLYGLFGMVDIAVQSVGQFGRGTEHTVFDTVDLTPVERADGSAPPAPRPARFGTLICYEGIFPSLTRKFAAAGADFLVNISNDAWYGDTSAPHQHLGMAAMRAIENRRPLVRSTNTGISAFVTDEGRIGPTSVLFEEEVVVETLLVREVWSFYREYGDVFLHACQALVALLVLIAFTPRGIFPASWQESSQKSARE